MVMIMTVFSLCCGLRIGVPSGVAAGTFAAQTALPLLAIGLWAGWEARMGRDMAVLRPVGAVICYAVVMIVHFNLKLWVPFVRPVTYDAVFWRIDQTGLPLVRLCRAIGSRLGPVVGGDGAYLGALSVMFYLSFGYHASRTPEVLRTLFLSALILQGLGALAYYVMPALGPFLFERGIDPALTDAQHHMLAAHRMAVAVGPRWLADNG